MAFDPLEWLETAAKLHADGTEASRRTAVGRLYYGVWLKSLIALEEARLMSRRGAREDHREVITVLKSNRRGGIATALENLERARRKADYQESEEFTEKQFLSAKAFADEVRRLSEPDWK
ncbi:MAG: hypothetical protein AB7J35_00700 [Dehalococcoidia bacterium]